MIFDLEPYVPREVFLTVATILGLFVFYKINSSISSEIVEVLDDNGRLIGYKEVVKIKHK